MSMTITSGLIVDIIIVLTVLASAGWGYKKGLKITKKQTMYLFLR